METISLKTVYQTLYDLAELGEIATLDVGTGMTRFDPNVDDPHHHLVCRSCGSVRDLVAAFPALRSPRGPISDSRWARPRSSSGASAPSVSPCPSGTVPLRDVTWAGDPDVSSSNPPAEASTDMTAMKGTP